MTVVSSSDQQPGGAPAIKRYVYGEPNAAIDHAPTRAQLIKASRHLQPGACVDQDTYAEVTQAYLDWRGSDPILVDIHGNEKRNHHHMIT